MIRRQNSTRCSQAISAWVLVLILILATQAAIQAEDPGITTFFKKHCTECHGEKKQKADLRIDKLGMPTLEGENGDSWQLVVDMISSGDMPPAKQARPAAAETEFVIQKISEALARSTPRTPALRRLNRVEYEHTVHDLLGIETPLADRLPEDASVQGFDNVANGLSISSILMERYLEAADTAFEGVIRRIKPLPPSTRRMTIMEGKENIESVAKKKGGVINAEGAFIKFTPGWPPVRIDAVHPIEDGVYRCRIAVWPHQPGDRTLAVAVYVGPLFGPGKRRFMGMYDVTGTPEEPRIIEFTTRIRESHTMHIVPWVYPEHVTWRDKDKEARPGVAVAWAETHGPLDQEFPSTAQRRLFGDAKSLLMKEGIPFWMRHRKGVKLHDVESSTPEADAERIVREFIPRAFRRPVKPTEADPFVKLTLDRLKQGRTFEQALRAGVSAALCAPDFLILNSAPETKDQGPAGGRLDDHTLASRLSYFLWSSLPDKKLLDLAAKGKLQDPGVRRQQVERMLEDPKGERFVKHFTGQWLGLRDIEFTSPDKKLYPEFDDLLQESMLGETREFFRHVLENDLSVLNFIDSEFTFLNERLARHYGIDGIRGHEKLRLVKLPDDSIRGGVLAHASVLKVTANGTNTSPILRGVWVLDHLLAQPPLPPPPGIPAFEPDIRGATTVREQLDKHRANESCARCHHRIDPPGFALEQFDATGREREWYRSLAKTKDNSKRIRHVAYTIGPDVDASGVTTRGTTFKGFREFRSLLAREERAIVRAIAQKLLVYGTGRAITAADREVVDAVVRASEKKQFGLRSMIHAVVESELFHLP